MSWFTDIAGKAENLLNKIDQNAASVLKQSEKDAEIQEESLLAESNNTLMSTSTDSIISSSEKPTTLRKSLSLLNTVDYHKDSLNSGGKSQSASTSRKNSVSSKSSKADTATVVSIGGNSSTFGPVSSLQKTNNIDVTTKNVDVELAATKIVLNEIKAERDELKLEIESLMEQVKDETSQTIIRDLQTTNAQFLEENQMNEQKNDKLEKSNANYIKSISDLESKLSKMHQIEHELNEKLKWAQRESEQAINELQQYRLRAQTTLQMKEQLIEQLKSTQNGLINTENVDGQESTSLKQQQQLEFEHLKNENFLLTEENKQKTAQLEQIRKYVDKFELIQREQQIDFDAKLLMLGEKLKQDERKWMHYEAEYKAQSKELATVRAEMNRIQMGFAGELKQK